jgi:decaprenylphospho-beta-D-erythro-pentofuranosid-2-ulose 2-reductase
MRDAVGNVNSVLVLGGGSEIAAATVDKLVEGRCRSVLLAVRDPAKVQPLLDRWTAKGVSANAVVFDAAETAGHAAAIGEMFSQLGDVDLVISAFGQLGNQDDLDNDPAGAADLAQVNFSGQVSALTACSSLMRAQGHGTIAVLSSVAGERPRKDNAVYGATKAGLDAFAQALSDRLRGSGVSVMVVRPGFVHTQMTDGLEAAPFATTPERVADDILTGLRRNSTTVWSPPVLRPVFTVLRHLPRPVWRILSDR